jgi:hypothetical protein
MPPFFMTEHKLYAIFNSKTRKFTTFTFDISVFPPAILNNMLIKEFLFSDLGLTDNRINLSRFKWEGDYDNGRLVDVISEKKSIVTQKEVDTKYSSIFFSKYNNDLSEIIYEIILNLDMKTDRGKEMQEFLNTLLEKKRKDIEFYKNSDLHIYETDEEAVQRQKDAFSNSKI